LFTRRARMHAVQQEHVEDYSFKTGASGSLLEQMAAEAAVPSHTDHSHDALLTTIQARGCSAVAASCAIVSACVGPQAVAAAQRAYVCRTAVSAGLCGLAERSCTSRCWLRCMRMRTPRLTSAACRSWRPTHTLCLALKDHGRYLPAPWQWQYRVLAWLGLARLGSARLSSARLGCSAALQ